MHIVDWLPTIASLAGYASKLDLKWDGINQWDALTGQATSTTPRTIYIATASGHALRHGDWKLIERATGKSQLFNIADDPYEKADLVTAEPTKLAELQILLAQQRALDDPRLPEDLVGLPK